MRDVRRDGLIEAFLIAFTPPRGLPYPRVYPRFTRIFLAVSGRERHFSLPSLPIVLHRLPLLSPAAITFLLPHHDLHHRTFRLPSMQRHSRYLLWGDRSPSLLEGGSFLLFQRSKPLRHYINALIGVVARARPWGLGDEGTRARAQERPSERWKEKECKLREGEPRITGIICPPARATISPDPPAISRSSSASQLSRDRFIGVALALSNIVYHDPTTMTRCSISSRIDHRTERSFFFTDERE